MSELHYCKSGHRHQYEDKGLRYTTLHAGSSKEYRNSTCSPLSVSHALAASIRRLGRAVQSTFLIEIDMELVDLEPQTFEVKLDREFLYSPCPTVLAQPPVNIEDYESKQAG